MNRLSFSNTSRGYFSVFSCFYNQNYLKYFVFFFFFESLLSFELPCLTYLTNSRQNFTGIVFTLKHKFSHRSSHLPLCLKINQIFSSLVWFLLLNGWLKLCRSSYLLLTVCNWSFCFLSKKFKELICEALTTNFRRWFHGFSVSNNTKLIIFFHWQIGCISTVEWAGIDSFFFSLSNSLVVCLYDFKFCLF